MKFHRTEPVFGQIFLFCHCTLNAKMETGSEMTFPFQFNNKFILCINSFALVWVKTMSCGFRMSVTLLEMSFRFWNAHQWRGNVGSIDHYFAVPRFYVFNMSMNVLALILIHGLC